MPTDSVVGELFAAQLKGKRLASWKPGQLLDFLQDSLVELLSNIDIDSLPVEARQQIHDAVKRVYDTVLRPMDIPYIPAIAESLLEDWVWSMICKELDRRLNLVHE